VAAAHRKSLLPVLAAIGGACGLAAAPVAALELGDIRMESTLGQPLRASIAFALNPNEQLHDYCIYLRPGPSGGPIASVTRASLAVNGNRILISGNTPVMDPLLNLQLAVDCPYTPNLSRQYTMIIDPVLPTETAPMYAATRPANSPAANAAPTAPQVTQRTQATREQGFASTPAAPLAAGDEYRVRTGDTASTIAARVGDRDVSLRTAVERLVITNPDAFLQGDADRIMAGSVLTLPDLTEAYVASNGATRTAAASPASRSDTADIDAYSASLATAEAEPASAMENDRIVREEAAPESDVATSLADVLPGPSVETTAEPTSAPEPVPAASTSALPPVAAANVTVADEALIDELPVDEPVAAEPAINEPVVGDVGAGTPQVTPAADTGVDSFEDMKPGDVFVAAPAAARAAPPVVVASSAPGNGGRADGGARSQTALLAGAGVLFLTGLAFFGRRMRDRFGSVAVNAPSTAAQPAEQAEMTNEKTASVVDDVDFEFEDTINAEAVSLDADLGAGTGLEDSSNLDVSQDFTFDSVAENTREMDLEITEAAAAEPESPTTDIIPPTHKVEEATILDDEVTPESDDYDMSMIVDATKQSIDYDDATARDLQAVPVDDDLARTGEYAITDDTLATEADLKALELDYEEEFTQTQALNQEIEEAAKELAAKLDPADLADALEIDPELDPTAEMPASSTDADAEEITANLELADDAVNDDIVDSDITSKLATAGSDVTVEMQVESGKVDTKNSA
jgi:hypothetical protein